jgi:gamma-glutamyl-gamma-aminobutyrate hydrolase PuuD
LLLIDEPYSKYTKKLRLEKEAIEFLVEKGAVVEKLVSIRKDLSLESYKYLLEHGLKADLVLSIATETLTGEINEPLLELAVKHQADLNLINDFEGLPSLNTLKLLLNNGLSPNKALKLIAGYTPGKYDEGSDKLTISPVKQELQQNLIKWLLDANADIKSIENFNTQFFSVELLELFIDKGADLNTIIINILYEPAQIHQPSSAEYQSASLAERQKHILKLAIAKGADINSAFSMLLSMMSDSANYEVDMGPSYVIPQPIMENLLTEYSLNPNLVLEYAINNGLKDFAELALKHSADANGKALNGDVSLFNKALSKGKFDIVEMLLNNGASHDLELSSYIKTIEKYGFHAALKVVELFPNVYNKDKAYELLRADGLSEIQVKAFIGLHDLIVEYNRAKQGQSHSFSNAELQILSNSNKNETFAEYKNITPTNSYGYSLLHLAIIASKYDLAEDMIKNGCDVYAQNYQGVTPLNLIIELYKLVRVNIAMYERHNGMKKLLDATVETIHDVDLLLGKGASLVDTLIQNPVLREKAIEKTQDSLFYFFKKDADLLQPSTNPDQTYIGISHGEHFWSSGVWELARLLKDQHSDVVFYLVDNSILERGGESFIKQFDAFINPGAGDTYPEYLDEFTKADCPFSQTIEQHYQNVLEQTHQFNIPYLGMCAGAQHFSMYHGGSLKPLKKYNFGQHQITFNPGSLAHFLSLGLPEQKQALANCEFQQVSFKGDTAHNYAAIVDKLGQNLQLGAVSEDGVAMAYAHENGIRYATQYHPEHYYHSNKIENIYQKSWFDNFISLAKKHHDYRIEEALHPINYFQQVQERLEECAQQPTCLAQELEMMMGLSEKGFF